MAEGLRKPAAATRAPLRRTGLDADALACSGRHGRDVATRAAALAAPALKPHERPRIVAMTANAMQGDRQECLAAGIGDHVTKPIRVDALVEALNQAKARHAQ